MIIIYGDIGIGVRWNIPPHFKQPFYGDIMGIKYNIANYFDLGSKK